MSFLTGQGRDPICLRLNTLLTAQDSRLVSMEHLEETASRERMITWPMMSHVT